MRRKLLSLLLAATCVLSLTACGGGTATQPAPEAAPAEEVAAPAEETAGETAEPVELTLWVTSRGADDFADEWKQKFLDNNPNITLNEVVREGDPGNEFYQGVAAGNAPDVIQTSFAMLPSYITAGIVEPLDDYMAAWDESGAFTQSYLDMFKSDGHYYGLPNQAAPVLFAYNKELLAAAGVDKAPETWDEALEAAKKVSDPDNQIIGYATLAAEWTEWFFQFYVWQAGGDLTVENPDGTATLTFTDDAVIEAANYYKKLVSEGVLQSDRTMTFGDLLAAFGQGRIGMMPFAGDWVADAVNNGMDPDNLGLIIPPKGPKGDTAVSISGSVWIINKNSDQAHKDAAWEYIKHYQGKEYLSAYYANNASKGAMAPVIIARDDMSITDFATFPDGYKEVLEAAKTLGRGEFYAKGSLGSYVDRAVQNILSNPNSDPMKEFQDAQDLCTKEALDQFNEENKR